MLLKLNALWGIKVTPNMHRIHSSAAKCEPKSCVCLLSDNSWVSNTADLSAKTFFPLLTCFSESSRSIKGLSHMKEIQNESIKRISHCQMFYMKYSTICLFAVILFDVCWGVVMCLFDMYQMSTDGWRVGVQWFPPDFFSKTWWFELCCGDYLWNTTKSNRFHRVIGVATSKMIEIKRRWRDLLGFDVSISIYVMLRSKQGQSLSWTSLSCRPWSPSCLTLVMCRMDTWTHTDTHTQSF